MDNQKTIEEILNMLEMQEDILQFTHFSNADAIALGRFMLDQAAENGLSVAIGIWRSNGERVFQALMEGTTPDNSEWLRRKFNTVNRMEMSTLGLFMRLKKNDQTMAEKLLNETEYACSGGGFPIRLEDAGVVGALTVSGLNPVMDHDFIVRCLSKYLHVDEVPRIRQGDLAR